MKNRVLGLMLGLVVGCGGTSEIDGGMDAGAHDTDGQDAGSDAGQDAGLDGGHDAGVDAGQDAGVDAGQDAGVDAGQDAGVDAGQDAGVDAGQDAGVDAGRDAGPCSLDWCLAWPWPIDDDLRAVWALSASNVWAVGDHGRVRRFDGSDWKGVDAGTSGDFTDLWASSPSDVWLSGDGVVAHWRGVWELFDAGVPLNAIWGTPTGQVWTGGAQGTLSVWNGMNWDTVDAGISDDIVSGWANSDTDQWIATHTGVHHWDGTSWSHSELDAGVITRLRGRATNDVWAVGTGGMVLRFDGTQWLPVPSGTTADLHDVSGQASVMICGDNGVILDWNGTSLLPSMGSANNANLLAISEGGWAVGRGGATVRRTLSGWVPANTPDRATTTRRFAGVWGDLWAAGFTSVLHHDGVRWSEVSSPVGLSSSRWIKDLWRSPVGSVYLAGNQVAFVGDGGTWTALPVGASSLESVGGTSDSDVWFGGFQGQILHWNGQSLTSGMTPGSVRPIYALVATSPTDAWAFGADSIMFRWNGTDWVLQPQLQPQGRNWNTAHATSPTNVWVAGSLGAAYAWGGLVWTPIVPLATSTLYSVWPVDSSDVWFSGPDGFIAHWNGTTTTVLAPPTITMMRAIWADQQHVFVEGDGRIWYRER